MTQCDMILRYMEEEGSITPVDALREFGCFRLGARIYDLRKRGVDIIKTPETRENRYGKRVCYARYSVAQQ